LLTSLDAADLVAIEPDLKGFGVPTAIVWGTGDPFFDVSWASWLRDTIPGADAVVELPGARLFFPEERPDELASCLLAHWAAH
jgi:pimeloyl-ACP methyl ester carboxylesterase